ncbi:uncharacterized protein CPUR_05454 [Claviceps purpurea 20.1]|uniref:Uncharacterized protein n=1 Tax=Claviceps purpurea (strain 20.1) TaxID=1111077 RepID=M1W278_CLAP2|nr:uncharacterized protein CPUR_05454 [Claviceps purpurea 20.1]
MSGADFMPSFELGSRQIIFLPIRSAPSAAAVLPRRPDTEGQQVSEVEEPVRNQTGDNQTLESLDSATRSLKLKVRKKRRRTAAGSTCFRIIKQSRKEEMAEELRRAKRDLKEAKEERLQNVMKDRNLTREIERLRREIELLRRQKLHEHVESEFGSGSGSAP